ncbi:MAG: helix-turn-helix transcriptional regulator [Clostridia bacterium]|nr:helix-turn-helix transcriptional regulator [Clostridia bacterium]
MYLERFVNRFFQIFKIFFQEKLKFHLKYAIIKIHQTLKGSAIIMTMGTYIKHLREQAGISQEELGKSLNPPVNRAAVNKWETGQVENIKRTHIQQLANKFGVTPCELMCFDSKFDTPRLAEEVKAIELVQKHFGMDAVRMLQYFQELNHIGKEKALEDLGDLVQLSKYTEKGESSVLKNA